MPRLKKSTWAITSLSKPDSRMAVRMASGVLPFHKEEETGIFSCGDCPAIISEVSAAFMTVSTSRRGYLLPLCRMENFCEQTSSVWLLVYPRQSYQGKFLKNIGSGELDGNILYPFCSSVINYSSFRLNETVKNIFSFIVRQIRFVVVACFEDIIEAFFKFF